jgi:exopolysaccharide production protein ExoY
MGFRSADDAQGFSKFVPVTEPVAWVGTKWQRAIKRTLDLLGAGGLLVFTLPLVLLASLLVWLQDGQNPLFCQKRIGRGGRRFKVFKLRTMVPDAQSKLLDLLDTYPSFREEWTATQKLAQDPRITALGWFLRRSSIDELPQLLNVLRGEMSLVGPRPIVQSEIERYGRAYPTYCSVMPGLTGAWQVHGRSDTSYAERVAIDVAYANRWSVKGDIGILLRTIPAVFLRRGAH